MSTVLEYAKSEGVKDLPIQVRAKFAKALSLEEQGQLVEASLALDEAIRLESQ